MESKYQSVYSLKLMQDLVAQGYFPVKTLPNPVNSKYKYWVFKKDEDGFEETFNILLASLKSSRRGDNEDAS